MRNKIVMVVLSVALVVSLVLVGCAKPAPAQKIRTIITCPMASTCNEARGLKILSDKLETDPRTKDRLDVMFYDNGMLYNHEDGQYAVSSGAAQITLSGPWFLELFDPEWRVLTAPVIIQDLDHAKRIVKTPAWQELAAKTAKKGIIVADWYIDAGDWVLYARHPINDIEDIKGETFRYSGGVVFEKTLKALGLSPVPLPVSDVVTALETGMIDGLTGDMVGSSDYYDLYHYCPHCLYYRIGGQAMCFIFSATWWNSLGPELRSDVQAVTDEASQAAFEDLEVVKKEMRDKWTSDPGCTLVFPTDEQKAKWDAILMSVVDETCGDIDPDLLAAIEDTKV